jgi:hypothetical protein
MRDSAAALLTAQLHALPLPSRAYLASRVPRATGHGTVGPGSRR